MTHVYIMMDNYRQTKMGGADQQYDTGVQVTFTDTTTASNSTTTAVMVSGGLAVGAKAWVKDLNVDDDATIGTATDINS